MKRIIFTEKQKSNPDTMLHAMKDDSYRILEMISDTLRCNKQFMLETIKIDFKAFSYASFNLKCDESFRKEALAINSQVKDYMPPITLSPCR